MRIDPAKWYVFFYVSLYLDTFVLIEVILHLGTSQPASTTSLNSSTYSCMLTQHTTMIFLFNSSQQLLVFASSLSGDFKIDGYWIFSCSAPFLLLHKAAYLQSC